MFETTEPAQKISKRDYEARLPELRARLLEAQFSLLDRKSFPVLIVISGVPGAGRADTVNALKEWFDVRGLVTHAFWGVDGEEDHRPLFWKYWNSSPAKGQVGIYFGSWYTLPLSARYRRRFKGSDYRKELERVAAFERTLADDGALVLKFWLHLSKAAQKKRLEKLARDRHARGRFEASYWKFQREYRRRMKIVEEAIERTHTQQCPWNLVDAEEPRYRNLTVATMIGTRLQRGLEAACRGARRKPTKVEAAEPIEKIDLSRMAASRHPPSYKKKLEKAQAELGDLSWRLYDARRSTVVCFEGWDAAGKGGTIRRLSWAIDARLMRVISITAPTDEEKVRHYLWRFWRQLPRAGRITAYDRSWYGRVLVERVERYAKPAEWQRAYREINEFEEHLTRAGVVLLKFFLNISKREQLARFHERERVRYKNHKITPEDWRNREKWDAYEEAIVEMIARTSTEEAPWHVVPANSKRFARVEVLRTIARAWKKAL